MLFELRGNSHLADRILSRTADICADLFGAANSDLSTLQIRLTSRKEQLGVQKKLFAEIPDEATAAKITLALASLGNVHSETLRAFTEDEYRQIVSELP